MQKATTENHEILTAITKRSKAYWGYSAEQIEAWSELLTITKEYIEKNPVYKLVNGNEIIGYYSFFYEDEHTIRLDFLFLLPEYIGMGLGQTLMKDFLNRIKATDAKRINLHSEPKAENFYARFGFVKIGQLETSIKNRYLPVMELIL